jgi:hypothetical protein
MWCRESKRGLERDPGAPGRTTRGITLLELALSTALAAGAMALAFTAFSMVSAGMHAEQRLTDCQMEQADAFSELEADIRNAGADPAGARLFTGTTYMLEIVPKNEALAGGLRLRSDLTGPRGVPDGDLDDAGEVVVWALDPATAELARWAANGTGGMERAAMLRRVVAFELSFLDPSGAPVAVETATQVVVTTASRVDAGDERANAAIRRQRFTIALPNRSVTPAP